MCMQHVHTVHVICVCYTRVLMHERYTHVFFFFACTLHSSTSVASATLVQCSTFFFCVALFFLLHARYTHLRVLHSCIESLYVLEFWARMCLRMMLTFSSLQLFFRKRILFRKRGRNSLSSRVTSH